MAPINSRQVAAVARAEKFAPLPDWDRPDAIFGRLGESRAHKDNAAPHGSSEPRQRRRASAHMQAWLNGGGMPAESCRKRKNETPTVPEDANANPIRTVHGRSHTSSGKRVRRIDATQLPRMSFTEPPANDTIPILPIDPSHRQKGTVYRGKTCYVAVMGNRGRVRGDICQVCALRSTVRVGKYKNEAGQKYKLCSDCAKKEGTWELLNPCELCPEGDKTDANYKNTEGQKKKLCSDCAKKEGTWEVQHPCELCPEGDKTDAAYKNTEGQKNKLCSDCAKKEGTWEVQHPCELCPEGDKTDAAYKNTEGQKYKLCSSCAVAQGTHYAMVRGASLVACQFFDRLKQHYGEEYPHVHYHMDADGHSTTTGKEVTGLVPGRKIRPDSFIAARNEVWLFHGNYYHGYPPDHPRHERGCGVGDISNKELYDGTLKVMHMYADAGYRVKYAWEHEFREVTRAKLPRRLESVIRAFA